MNLNIFHINFIVPMGLQGFMNKLNEPKNNAAFICINLLLGTGPLIVPEPFFRAGFLFSTLWTILVLAISYNAAVYIGESIELLNSHQSQNTLIGRAQTDRSLISTANEEDHTLVDSQPTSQEGHPKTITTFDHSQQFSILFGKKYLSVPVLAITIYLFGVLISKCIMTGRVLSKLMGDIDVLNTFEFWLIVFFIIGGAFSFKSIEKTKVIQVIMISVRIISILLLLIGSIVIMIQNGGIKDLSPEQGNAYFNSVYFSDVFSNLIFSFMFHHSLPGITKQLTKLSHIRSFLKVSFLAAGLTVIVISVTASMAFGNELIEKSQYFLGEHHHLKYYNQDYKDRIDLIYYFVSFYVFLNVAAFSVYIIVIRKNVLVLARPELDSDKVSKTTILVTGILLALLLVISYLLKNDIQVVLDFTGGILGSFNLLIMPSMEVYKARKLFPPKKSWLNSYVWFPLFFVVLGVAAIVYNLYRTISGLVQ